MGDDPFALESHYLSMNIAGSDASPEDIAAACDGVTAEDVVRIAQNTDCDAIYYLKAGRARAMMTRRDLSRHRRGALQRRAAERPAGARLPAAGLCEGACFFATKYGGAMRRFTLDGRAVDTHRRRGAFPGAQDVRPAEGNALAMLSQRGARANAFTSSGITAYHFDCTGGLFRRPRAALPLCQHALFHGGERAEGAGHHRPGDTHDRGQPGLRPLLRLPARAL